MTDASYYTPWENFDQSIQKVIIEDGVTYIGAGIFKNFINMKEIHIPSSVTSVGYFAFQNCTSLEAVYADSLDSWLSLDISQTYASPLQHAGNLYLGGKLLVDLVIPEGITAIGANAFYGCTSLKSVSIPRSVTSIGDYAFNACTGLTSVSIPSNVASVGRYAFQNCTGLVSASIADGVVSIGNNAFQSCTALVPSSSRTVSPIWVPTPFMAARNSLLSPSPSVSQISAPVFSITASA